MVHNRSNTVKLGSGAKAFRSGQARLAWLTTLVLMLAFALPAVEPIKMTSLKVGTKTYRRITILGASETDLYFRHSTGIANVKLKYLEPEMQKRFDYDPKAAEEAEQRAMQEDSAYFETVAIDVGTRAHKAAAAATAAKAASERAANSENSVADPIASQSLLNRPGPKLEVGKWLGEEPVTEGKAVLVFFWATWSVPCRKAISDLNAHQKTFREQLAIIGLSSQEENEVADFSEVKVDFPVAVDPKSKLAEAAGVTSVPQVLLMDAKGIVRYVGHPAALDSPALKKLLAKSAE